MFFNRERYSQPQLGSISAFQKQGAASCSSIRQTHACRDLGIATTSALDTNNVGTLSNQIANFSGALTARQLSDILSISVIRFTDWRLAA